MTTSKDQPQAIVFNALVAPFRWFNGIALKPVRKLHQRCIEPSASTQSVDGFESARRNQPCTRVCRNAILRPLFHSRGESFTHGFLGPIKVADQTDESGEDAETRHGT